MVEADLRDAVILAAGNGSRLSGASGTPKPLVSVNGRPLLEHAIALAATAGVRTAHVITGYGGDLLRRHALQPAPSIAINWVHNERFSEPNGVSALCAEPFVRTPFLLVMADHLFEPQTVRRFVAAADRTAEVTLAVDSKLDAIWDLPDATKVWTRNATLSALGKTLERYNAIDCGMFICGAAIFDALRASVAAGDASLTGGVGLLARAGRVRTWDLGDDAWIDIDTPGALEHAERLFERIRVGAGL